MTSDLAAPAVRRLDSNDAEAIFAILSACDLAEVGEPDLELSDVEWFLGVPSEWYGVDSADGGLEAYACAGWPPGHLSVAGDVRVRPGGDPSWGPRLLPLVQAAAARLAPDRDLHFDVHVADRQRPGWFTAVGGRVIRQLWRMSILLDDTHLVPPQPRPEVDVRFVGADEVAKRSVFDVVDVAFRDHFGHDPTRSMTFDQFLSRHQGAAGFDDRLWWLASVDGQPAAALIGRESPDAAWVDTLGTLGAWRGRGLARLLLRTAFAEFRRRGFGRALLGVDASNPTGAVALYESVGMTADQSWQIYSVPPLVTS